MHPGYPPCLQSGFSLMFGVLLSTSSPLVPRQLTGWRLTYLCIFIYPGIQSGVRTVRGTSRLVTPHHPEISSDQRGIVSSLEIVAPRPRCLYSHSRTRHCILLLVACSQLPLYSNRLPCSSSTPACNQYPLLIDG